MKTKNLLALLALLFLGSNPLFATDRIVQQNGPAGTFSSISSAITAAVDGDIIVINNRTDGTAWTEDLTINKSLTLISAADNVQWWMNGAVSFTQAEGRVISLIGMKNTTTSGTINKTGTTPVNRMQINIVHSDISANISLTNVNLYLASSVVTGTVNFSYGKIIGSEFNKTITMSADATATEDVNLVIGNKMVAGSVSGYCFYANSTTQYLQFSNNYARGSTGSANAAVAVVALKSGAVGNRITNCSMVCAFTGSTGSAALALYVAQNTGTLAVENCIISGNYVSASNGGNAFLVQSWASSLTTFTYNMYYNPFSGTTLSTLQGNIQNTSLLSTNFTTDGAYTGGSYINLGNPGNTYLDLDLTRNDIGAYGGSYSLENFLPIMSNPQSSRVNLVTGPRVVNQGGIVTIQAIGFDK